MVEGDVHLFAGYEQVSEVKDDRLTRLKSQLSEAPEEDYLEMDEEEFIDKVVSGGYSYTVGGRPVESSEVSLDIPQLDLENFNVKKKGEAGNLSLKVEIEGSGNTDLLTVDISEDLEPIHARIEEEIEGFIVKFSVPFSEQSAQEVNSEINQKIEEMKHGLETLQDELKEVNNELREYAREEFRDIREQVKEDEEKTEELDFDVED